MIVGINKKITTIQGFEASYWRLASYTVNHDLMEASAVFNLYKDKTVADSDTEHNKFIESHVIATAGDGIDNEFGVGERFISYIGSELLRGGVKQSFYDMALETDTFFEGATAVIEELPPEPPEPPLTPEEYIANFREAVQEIKSSGMPVAGAKAIVDEEYSK